MSIQIMQAVWQHSRSTGRARLVLLAIADHQGEIGAWPSIATIATMVNSSERSVQRDIQELVDLGELTVEVQNAPTRHQYKSNLYWVNLPGVTELKSGVTKRLSGVTESASGVTAGGVLTLKEPLLEPLHKPSDEFETFWKQYPRHEGKASAEKAYLKALKKISHSELVKALERYKAHNQKHSIIFAHAASWLNAERWADEYDVMITEVREKAKAVSDEYLTFLREQEKLAAPAPKCPHGENVALCRSCL
jgi:hypothetical protein